MPNISYKHFIYDHELMLLPYTPLGLLHNQGEWPEPKYKLSIIASVSAKDINLIQWITYHQTLGIDHIYLYCTDDDPTDLYRQIIAFTLGKNPYITFHHYRFSNSTSQHYFHFIHNYLHETEWYINLDIIDYLYIHEKQTISEFLDRFSNINAVYFNMFLYKNNETKENINNKTFFEQYLLINYPCIYTKLMIRSHACPYQHIFNNLDKSIDHFIHNEKLINHTCNVLRYDMKDYYEDFPNNALETINLNIQEQIIIMAYIARFDNSNDEKEIINGLSKLYISHQNNKNIEHQYGNQHINLQQYKPEKYWEKTLKTAWKQSFLPASLPLLSVISDGKPCKQSSIPEKALSKDLACSIINKKLQGIAQTITKKESNPWWEIDLQETYIIKVVRLFNGIDLNIINMKNFIIESSDDYQTWIKRYHKLTPNLFGGVDGSYCNWIHPLGIKARWIRITVPGNNKIFSLDQIQILGIEHKNFHVP